MRRRSTGHAMHRSAMNSGEKAQKLFCFHSLIYCLIYNVRNTARNMAQQNWRRRWAQATIFIGNWAPNFRQFSLLNRAQRRRLVCPRFDVYDKERRTKWWGCNINGVISTQLVGIIGISAIRIKISQTTLIRWEIAFYRAFVHISGDFMHTLQIKICRINKILSRVPLIRTPRVEEENIIRGFVRFVVRLPDEGATACTVCKENRR